jgi:hypothetical protein
LLDGVKTGTNKKKPPANQGLQMALSGNLNTWGEACPMLALRRSKALEEEKCPDEKPNAACANRQNEVQKMINRLDRFIIFLPALRAVILNCFLTHDALPVCYLAS